MRTSYYAMLALIILSLVAVGCAPVSPSARPGVEGSDANTAADAATLTVFAAASLTDAFGEIGQGFATAYPHTEVVFNFAGSNQLAAQIGEGAPADVFASANKTQMNAAIDTGRVVSGTQRTFVRNRLVVVTPGDNPAGLTTLQDLTKPGIKIVLAAKEVPVGQYALDFLGRAEADGSLGAGYRDAVLANVVSYEENVRAVLTKVALGEADAGIVYTSDAAANTTSTADTANAIGQIAIPDAFNTIANYPIAPLNDSPHLEQAQQFVNYVLSSEGQQILERYGFIPAAAQQ